jgi:hypothetical protein
MVKPKTVVMGLAGACSKDDGVDEDQQQFTRETTKARQNRETEKIWSWVPQGLKPRMTVLAKATSNLSIYPKPKSRQGAPVIRARNLAKYL